MPRALAVARALTALRSYPAAVLADAPAGYWRLGDDSGNLQDLSGNNFTATPAAGISYRASGLLSPFAGAAINMGAATVLGTVADNATLSITGNLTLECWLQRPNTTTSTYGLISKGQVTGSPSNASYALDINGSNGLSFWSSVDGSTMIQTTSPNNALLDTNVHHCVVTYQLTGKVICIYIDAKLVKRVTTGPAAIFDSAASFRIGANGTNADAATGAFTSGIMQEVAVYPSVLSAARVAVHYQIGKQAARSLSAARALAS